MRKRYTKGKKVVPNLVRGKTGRVGYHGGGHNQERETGAWIPHDPNETNDEVTEENPLAIDDSRDDPTDESPFSETTAAETSEAQREREYRAAESAKRMEQMAIGEVKLSDIGAEGKAADITVSEDELLDSEKAGYKVKEDAKALTTADYAVSKDKADLTESVDTITKEELGLADTERAEVVASTMKDIKEVDESVAITGAQGELDENARISEQLGVARVNKIDPAKVKIEEGSVAKRIVGKLNEEAFAKAVKVSGISLPRVTRAKQQLATAGVSPETIQLLGNDPDTLEAELMNFSEKDRGVIGGLPVEALVSTQMATLFEGMNEGEIPLWAKPATDKVEAALAERGLSASTVGRDSLTAVLVGEAFKIADSNAKAIQASVSQGKSIEAQALQREAEFAQQTGLSNADKVFNLNMKQFDADQQTAISNSKFMQTVSLTNTGNEQQAAVQNAILASQANLSEADLTGTLRIENAKGFLATNRQ